MAADPEGPIPVSVVMPARDAAGTIREALDSLLAQTVPDWEVVVVDDGSRDGTRAIVEALAARDPRVRMVGGPGTGPAAARNAGIAAARFDWLAFLDADDRWEPEFLEALTGVLRADPELDGAHCGWARVAVDGARDADERCTATGDLFPLLARRCAVTINSCVIRRARVLQAGGFDPGYPHAEDWDLWQRVARTGARFGRVPRTLALYRLSAGSVSLASEKVLASSLRVLDNGSRPDPRVADPSTVGRAGVPIEPAWRWIFAVWCAGAELALCRDARPLLDRLPGPGPELDPLDVAEALRRAVPYGSGRIPRDWIAIWPEVETGLLAFLAALEERTGTPLLARRALRALEGAAVAGAAGPRPATLGSTHGVAIDAAGPIADVRPPAGAERLHIAVTAVGEALGAVELPVCDGVVPGAVIADAIAAEHAWELLGRFLARSAYPALGHPAEAHDEVGWTVMLQELWDRPGWDGGRFYDPAPEEDPAPERRTAQDGLVAIEVSAEPPDVEVGDAGALRALVTVGGAALGVVEVPADGPVVPAQAIRAAVTTAGGFELCRLAVREGVVGRPLDAPGRLRERLAAAAAAGPPARDPAALVLGRRRPEAVGGSPGRRAALPAAAAPALARAADAAGEPRTGPAAPARAAYDPDRIASIPAPARRDEDPDAAGAVRAEASGRNREHFESLFASGADPWRYTDPYESLKYRQTLEMLPPGPIGTALELACAEGHFTVELAARVGRLTAADISEIALGRARERCAGRANVRFVRLDLEADPLPGRFDLITCSEVLYYLSGIESLRDLARRIAEALEPGGSLVMAHANLVVDDPDRPGFAWPAPFGARVIGETMVAAGGLRLERELRTPLYRVQLLRKDAGPARPEPPPPPAIVEIDHQPELPRESVRASIRWSGGTAERTTALRPAVTDRLPILMYHRVAAAGATATARWRVDPSAFDEQLGYLRDAGFHGVSLAAWEAALRARRPLPGRAVCLTFDDGFADFAETAWPLLRRHGFTATVFVVPGAVGGTDRWNRRLGDEAPLLDWDQIRELAGEGVEIGSHSQTHAPLTALGPAGVADEAARSRAELEERLGGGIGAFAYPYGDADPAVCHLVGAAGYRAGVTCRFARSGLRDDPMALPRVEVSGLAGFDAFVASLSV